MQVTRAAEPVDTQCTDTLLRLNAVGMSALDLRDALDADVLELDVPRGGEGDAIGT